MPTCSGVLWTVAGDGQEAWHGQLLWAPPYLVVDPSSTSERRRRYIEFGVTQLSLLGLAWKAINRYRPRLNCLEGFSPRRLPSSPFEHRISIQRPARQQGSRQWASGVAGHPAIGSVTLTGTWDRGSGIQSGRIGIRGLRRLAGRRCISRLYVCISISPCQIVHVDATAHGFGSQFHDKFVNKLQWIDEQVVGSDPRTTESRHLTERYATSTKSSSASVRPSLVPEVQRCTTASI
jgi:hypothetical protein